MDDKEIIDKSQGVIAENNYAAESLRAARDLAELKRIELQMTLGFVTRRGIMAVAAVSAHTVKLWESRGLAMFEPGTAESWCTVSAFATFAANAESFAGVRSDKKKAKKK